MSAPRTPISAIRRGLRGAHPPGSFEARARAVIGLREDCSPEVCSRLTSIFRTLASPEPGTLDRDELRSELDGIAEELKGRRSKRLFKKQVLEERKKMEEAEEAAAAYRRKQMSGARWRARKQSVAEGHQEQLNDRLKRWERPAQREGKKRQRD